MHRSSAEEVAGCLFWENYRRMGDGDRREHLRTIYEKLREIFTLPDLLDEQKESYCLTLLQSYFDDAIQV